MIDLENDSNYKLEYAENAFGDYVKLRRKRKVLLVFTVWDEIAYVEIPSENALIGTPREELYKILAAKLEEKNTADVKANELANEKKKWIDSLY